MTLERIDIIGQNGNDGLHYLDGGVGDEQRHVGSNCPEAPDSSDYIPDAGEMISMAALYPAYYKDVSDLAVMDVYAVHDRFQIDDPSGCIHHASKKLLLCGVRTGGKPAWKEIKEASDTLTRKLQLMGVE